MGATKAQSVHAVGRRVRKAGERLNLGTRVARAKFCRLPLQTLRDYEAGDRAMGSVALQQICRSYGISADELLGLPR